VVELEYYEQMGARGDEGGANVASSPLMKDETLLKCPPCYTYTLQVLLTHAPIPPTGGASQPQLEVVAVCLSPQPPHQFSSASSTIMRAAQRRCLPLGRVPTRPAAAAALLPAAAAPPLSCAARGLASSSSARLEDLRKQLEEEDAAGIAMSLIPPAMPVAEAASADAASPAPRRKKRLEPKPSM